MATTRWISQDGNWASGGSWSTGSVPGSGDTAQFDGTSQASVTSGHTSGVSPFTNLIVTDSYAGDIGANGSELSATITNRIVHRGSGTIYCKIIGSTAMNTVIDSPNIVKAAEITVSDNSSNWITVKSGKLFAGTVTQPVNIVIVPRIATPAILSSISGSVLNVGIVVNNGGQILGRFKDLTVNSNVFNSGFVQFEEMNYPITTVYVNGGTFALGSNATSGQAVNNLIVTRGVADFSKLTNPFTISNLLQYGGEVKRSELLTITIERDYRMQYPDF